MHIYLIICCLIYSTIAIIEECWNGGYIKNREKWCTCPLFFENSAGDPGRCDWKSCGDRGVLEGNNSCTCERGWTGIHCDECTNDLTCMRTVSVNNTVYPNSVCVQNSVFSYENMNFLCEVITPEVILLLGKETTFQCVGVGFSEEIPASAKKECYFQGWSYITYKDESKFYGQTVSCVFSECVGTLTKQRSIIYRCEKSSCMVPFREFNDNAKKAFDPLYDAIQNAVEVECWENGFCDLRVSNLHTVKMEMNCRGSECLTEERKVVFPGPIGGPVGNGDAQKSDIRNILFVIFPTLIILCLMLIIGVSLFDVFLMYRTQLEKRALEKYENNAGGELTFSNLHYHVWVTNKRYRDVVMKCRTTQKLQILKNLSFKIERGQLVACMGATGAGKTTLLDILAQRNKSGKVSGTIEFNTNKPGSTFRRLTGYVVQEDCLMGTLTVKECVMFSADLRLPVTLCGEKKKKRVDDVMKTLGIFHLRNRKIGDEMSRGISGGEKKIVSVALELVVNPHLLFLDEPTSGLDSHTAYRLVSALKLMTLEQGRTIMMAIHQPRAKIFKMFDTLLLLSKGEFVYSGKATDVVKCFEERYSEKFIGGAENPADWILDLVSKEEKKKEAELFRREQQDNRKRKLKPRYFTSVVADNNKKNRRELEVKETTGSSSSSSSLSSEFDSLTSTGLEELESEEDDMSSTAAYERKRTKYTRKRISGQLSPASSSTGMVDEEELLLLTDEEWIAKFRKCTFYGEYYPSFEAPRNCTIGLTKFCVFIQFPVPPFPEDNEFVYHEEEDDDNELIKKKKNKSRSAAAAGHHHRHQSPSPGREVIVYYQSITNISEFNLYSEYENQDDDDDDDGSDDFDDDEKKKSRRRRRRRCFVFQVEWQDRFFVNFKTRSDYETCKKEIEKLQYEALARANKMNIYTSNIDDIEEEEMVQKDDDDDDEYEYEYDESTTKSESESDKNNNESKKRKKKRKKKKKKKNFRKNEKEELKLIIKKEDILVYKKTDLMRLATPPSQQILTLSKRYFVHFLRNYYLVPMHVGSAIILGFLMGGIYFNSELNFSGAQNRFGVMFFMCSIMSFTSLSGLEIFIKERPLFVRERANNYYHPFVYFFVKVLFDLIPLRVIPPLFMGSISYYMIGLNPSFSNFVMFLLMILLFNVLSGAMVILIGTISSTVAFANIFGTLLILLNSVFGGFLVNRKAMPGWISWVRYLSYWNYVFENLMINELDGRSVTASEDVGLPYEILVPGEEVLRMFGMEKSNFTTNVIISFCMFLLFLFVSGVYVQIFIKEKK